MPAGEQGVEMKQLAFVIACAVPLAACNNSPEVHEENASVDEIQNKVAKAGGATTFVRPGKWESKVTIEEMSMPGMTAQMAEQMKSMSARVDMQQSCLTPAE